MKNEFSLFLFNNRTLRHMKQDLKKCSYSNKKDTNNSNTLPLVTGRMQHKKSL